MEDESNFSDTAEKAGGRPGEDHYHVDVAQRHAASLSEISDQAAIEANILAATEFSGEDIQHLTARMW